MLFPQHHLSPKSEIGLDATSVWSRTAGFHQITKSPFCFVYSIKYCKRKHCFQIPRKELITVKALNPVHLLLLQVPISPISQGKLLQQMENLAKMWYLATAVARSKCSQYKNVDNIYIFWLYLIWPSSCVMTEGNHNSSFLILHIFIQKINMTKLNSSPPLSHQTEASLSHNSQYHLKLGSKQVISVSLQYPLSYTVALRRKVVKNQFLIRLFVSQLNNLFLSVHHISRYI